jgi:hypothetical protein
MTLRWAAAPALETEKNFRKIIGQEDLWVLRAVLDGAQADVRKSMSTLDQECSAA